MAVSGDLSRLSTRAKEAEDRAAAAKTQARENLEQAITKAGASAQEVSDLARSESAAAAEKARSWGEGVQRSWKEHLAEVRQRADERKAERNAEQAEYNAEDAEDYAAWAIDFAYAAIGEAEYAVLDAVLARQDAQAAGAAGG
jgi:hypothetical protein